MVTNVAFIGLGVMGYPMAGHLAKSGLSLTVYNRTTAKARSWVDEFGGELAETPEAAVRDADIALACVGNDDDLLEVTIGEAGAFHTLKRGAIFIDHTTVSSAVAQQLYQQASERGIGFLDAPVSGGQAGAENAALTCMVGGDEDIYRAARPLLETYTRMLKLMGPAGTGQLTKMVNQICIAGIVQGLAEGLHFAMANGLDGTAVLDVISKGAAQSWQMENRGSTMLDGEFEFGFAVDWMRKDLDIVLGQARRCGAQLPMTAMVDQFYAQVQNLGGNRWDTSSLIAPLECLRNSTKT